MLKRVWFNNFEDLCSAELFDYKFLIPCDPVTFLKNNYGPIKLWMKPDTEGFKNIDFRHYRIWSKNEWPDWMRHYSRDGVLNVAKTLKDLNEHVKNGKPHTSNITDPVELTIE